MALKELIAALQKSGNTFNLSDWFANDDVITDGDFWSAQLPNTTHPQSICYCGEKKYIHIINSNYNVSCVITTHAYSHLLDNRLGIVTSTAPSDTFFAIHNRQVASGCFMNLVNSEIKPSAKIHKTAYIDPGVFIGERVIVGPGARILKPAYVADDTVIGANVVIGSEGLEFKRQQDQTLVKIQHAGGVDIGKNVEIMAGSVVAKDVYLGATSIGDGTKIGPLCNIGHRSSVGKNCMIAGHSTVSGSAVLGENVWIGPHAVVSNGITVGSGASISIGSVVVKDVGEGKKISGFFAMDHSKLLRLHAFFRTKGKVL